MEFVRKLQTAGRRGVARSGRRSSSPSLSRTGSLRGSMAIIAPGSPLAHLARRCAACPLTWEQQAQLEELAPTHLEVPTGSRIRIDYLDESAPAVSVRLQEVFGLEQTPTDRRRPRAHHLQAALAGTAPGAGHARSGELLARRLCRGAQGPARALSQALLAGESRSKPSPCAACVASTECRNFPTKRCGLRRYCGR